MKKQLLLAFSLSLSFLSFGQILNGSTSVNGGNMNVEVTVNTTTNQVELKLTGLSNGNYYAFGFGGTSMSGRYTIVIDGSGNVQERQLGNHNAGSALSSSVSVVSNTTGGGSRTVTLTRSRTGMTGAHYTFPNSASSFSIIWARGSSSSLSNHGSGNRGSSIVSLSNACNIPNTTLPAIHICDGDSAFVWGSWRTASNTYDTTYTTAIGCDSIVEQPVTVNPNQTYTQSPVLEICIGDSTQLFGAFVKSPGVYYDSLVGFRGCDSILAQEVAFDSVDIQVTLVNSFTFDASASNAVSYEWIDCSDLSSTGVTTAVFQATATGDYAVVVNNGNCSDTSACFSATIGLEEDFLLNTKALPNPFSDVLHIEDLAPDANWSIYNLFGEEIASGVSIGDHVELNTEEWPAGVYLMTIEISDLNRSIKLLKQ